MWFSNTADWQNERDEDFGKVSNIITEVNDYDINLPVTAEIDGKILTASLMSDEGGNQIIFSGDEKYTVSPDLRTAAGGAEKIVKLYGIAGGKLYFKAKYAPSGFTAPYYTGIFSVNVDGTETKKIENEYDMGNIGDRVKIRDEFLYYVYENGKQGNFLMELNMPEGRVRSAAGFEQRIWDRAKNDEYFLFWINDTDAPLRVTEIN